MPDNRVRTELLQPNEEDTLTRLGVTIEQSSLTFQRQLNEPEMRRVGSILIDLHDRTSDEENHINFVLGDWSIQAEKWFGQEMAENWPVQYGQLKKERDYTLQMTGGTLMSLQFLEHLIKVCCSNLRLQGINLTVEDVLSPETSSKKYTLGTLTKAFKDAEVFAPDFEARLDTFVKNRNRFIHYFFTEDNMHPSEGYVAFSTSQRQQREFISNLRKEATDLASPFTGLMYTTIKSAATREGKHKDFEGSELYEWVKNEQDYLDVRRPNWDKIMS